MWSFFTAGLTRRVCGREVVPGAAVCQGSVPRVPGVHHRRGLPHANALSRRHDSQVRNMGHGRTGKNTAASWQNTSKLLFSCPDLLYTPLLVRAPSCEIAAKETIR